VERGVRYHTLVERVSLDIIREARALEGRLGVPVGANVLEFKPFDECFYNAALTIPRRLPEEVAARRQEPDPGSLGPATVKLLQSAAGSLAGEIVNVFGRLETQLQSGEWLPALVSPELAEVVEAWRRWFEAQFEGRRARVPGRDDPACWQQLGSLLLSILPQPVHDPTNSAAYAIYRRVTGTQAGHDPGLDANGFLEPDGAGYLWRFGSGSGPFDRLRNVLELSFLVPLHPNRRRQLLRRLKEQGFNVESPLPAGDPVVRLTALGGPMIHHGQLEGILYVAARYPRKGEPFVADDNERMKELARDGATRRHQLRDQIVRDVLLREAQSSDAGERAPLLVLKHLSKLFSISAAACLDVAAEGSEPETGRLVARTQQPQLSRTMSSWPTPAEPAERFFDTLREIARRRLAPGDALCLGGDDPDVRRVVDRLDEIAPARVAAEQVRSMCLFPLSTRTAGAGEGLAWVFALLFPHPPTLGGDGSLEKNLANSVTQIQLELESLVDFVTTASRVSTLGRVLAQAGHALVQPVSHAASFAELAEAAFRRDRPQEGLEFLADTRLRLQHLLVMTRAAKQYFADSASPPEEVRINLAERVKRLLEMFTAAEPDLARAFVFPVTGEPPRDVLGDTGLCDIVLWQMIDNAVAATRRAVGPARDLEIEIGIAFSEADPAPADGGEPACGPRAGWATLTVRNPVARELSPPHLAQIEGHARRGVPNRSRSSGGTGLGLVYCYAMARKMSARFSLAGDFNANPPRVSATFSLPLAPPEPEDLHA